MKCMLLDESNQIYVYGLFTDASLPVLVVLRTRVPWLVLEVGFTTYPWGRWEHACYKMCVRLHYKLHEKCSYAPTLMFIPLVILTLANNKSL
jgi:hypothetical protein